MTYLFAAYSIIFLLMGGYMWMIGKRQSDALKEIRFLKQLEDEESL